MENYQTVHLQISQYLTKLIRFGNNLVDLKRKILAFAFVLDLCMAVKAHLVVLEHLEHLEVFPGGRPPPESAIEIARQTNTLVLRLADAGDQLLRLAVAFVRGCCVVPEGHAALEVFLGADHRHRQSRSECPARQTNNQLLRLAVTGVTPGKSNRAPWGMTV